MSLFLLPEFVLKSVPQMDYIEVESFPSVSAHIAFILCTLPVDTMTVRSDHLVYLSIIKIQVSPLLNFSVVSNNSFESFK